MSVEANLTVTAWTAPEERQQKIVDILSRIVGVRPGKEFLYRGMTLKKVKDNERSRREPDLEVYDPSGEYVGRFQPADMESREIVTMLDEERDQWAAEQQAASL